MCKAAKAAEATLNSLPLPQDLLEEIFGHLAYLPVLQAKQVCKEWKRVMESPSFTGSYSSTAKLVQADNTTEVVDSDGNVLLRKVCRLHFGNLVCPKTGLLNGHFMEEEDMFLVGNLFSDKWEAVPAPPGVSVDTDSVGVFGFGDGRYKIVYWHRYGEIYTRESGQQEWTERWSPGKTLTWPAPVVIGNSLFRYDNDDQRLLEYSSLGEGKLTAVDLTSKERFKYEWVQQSALIAWENRLYLLRIFDLDEGGEETEFQRVELWMIATNGACNLVMKHELDEWVGDICRAEIEDGKLVVQCDEPEYEDTGMTRLVCDMETKKIESIDLRDSSWKTMTLPLKLSSVCLIT